MAAPKAAKSTAKDANGEKVAAFGKSRRNRSEQGFDLYDYICIFSKGCQGCQIISVPARLAAFGGGRPLKTLAVRPGAYFVVFGPSSDLAAALANSGCRARRWLWRLGFHSFRLRQSSLNGDNSLFHRL